MEKFQVAMLEMESPKQKCSLKCVLLVVSIVLALVATASLIFFVSYLVTKTKELEYEISSLKKENECSKKQINNMKDQIRNKINGSLRDFVDKRMTDRIQGQIERIKSSNRSKPTTENGFRQSFNDMKDHLDVLAETVGNLSALLFRINSSSESTISHLRTNFTETKNDLVRLRKELTELNQSIHIDIVPFIISAVKDVKRELDMLRNTTTANVSGLWKHWNRTDAEIEDIIKLIAQQNETIHFKIAYHSDVLYSKVNTIEKRQSRFHNYTVTNMKDIRGELDQTRRHLEQTFDTKLARANTSWYQAIQGIDGSLRLSITKLNGKVDGIKQEIQKSINNIIKQQKESSDEFSKMKAGFQEKDRKHDLTLSDHTSKMKSMKNSIETLEGNLNSKTRKIENDLQSLQKSVNDIKSSANRVYGSCAPLVLVISLFTILYLEF